MLSKKQQKQTSLADEQTNKRERRKESSMNHYLSPSAVATYIKNHLEGDPLLSQVVVEGEVTNYTKASSGHHYFSLKDRNSILPCLMFRNDFPQNFPIANGTKILATGNITVFVQRGVYQLRCYNLGLLGAGNLHQEFLMMKAKLEEEGLFEQRYKKPLPRFPKTVALITSLTGAVVWDMLKIISSRSSLTEVRVIPVNVQGTGVEHQIAAAVTWADHYKVADVLIVGRGGGSPEDLRAFQTEVLARAIFQCKTPVISAVGHEPDVSICDYVADCRAATPTHAAELAIPLQADLEQELAEKRGALEQSLRRRLEYHRQQLDFFAQSNGFRDPKHHLREKAQMLDYQEERLEQAMSHLLHAKRQQCGQLAATLHALSPLEVMGRGYGIPRKEDGVLLCSVADTKIGEKISLSLADGTLYCRTEEIERD